MLYPVSWTAHSSSKHESCSASPKTHVSCFTPGELLSDIGAVDVPARISCSQPPRAPVPPVLSGRDQAAPAPSITIAHPLAGAERPQTRMLIWQLYDWLFSLSPQKGVRHLPDPLAKIVKSWARNCHPRDRCCVSFETAAVAAPSRACESFAVMPPWPHHIGVRAAGQFKIWCHFGPKFKDSHALTMRNFHCIKGLPSS